MARCLVASVLFISASCASAQRPINLEPTKESQELADLYVETVKSPQWRQAGELVSDRTAWGRPAGLKSIHMLLNEKSTTVTKNGKWNGQAYEYRRVQRPEPSVKWVGTLRVRVELTDTGLRVADVSFWDDRSTGSTPNP
jgi:hypothetical protein